MSSVHDTITEALEKHRYAYSSVAWCICGLNFNNGGQFRAHQTAAVLDALSAAGFVVRKQVEPPALRQEWTWSWPNGSARGVPGYGYPVDSAEEALAEAGVHDRRNANVVTRFVSEWQQVEP